MNSKFQVNDLVIAPRLFSGVLKVNQIMHDTSYPVIVEDGDYEFSFMTDGKESETDLQPSLFHSGTKITIEDVQPTRWPWLNVYQKSNGKIFVGNPCNTKAEALEKIYGNYEYLHTCQLTPPKKEPTPCQQK